MSHELPLAIGFKLNERPTQKKSVDGRRRDAKWLAKETDVGRYAASPCRIMRHRHAALQMRQRYGLGPDRALLPYEAVRLRLVPRVEPGTG